MSHDKPAKETSLEGESSAELIDLENNVKTAIQARKDRFESAVLLIAKSGLSLEDFMSLARGRVRKERKKATGGQTPDTSPQ